MQRPGGSRLQSAARMSRLGDNSGQLKRWISGRPRQRRQVAGGISAGGPTVSVSAWEARSKTQRNPKAPAGYHGAAPETPRHLDGHGPADPETRSPPPDLRRFTVGFDSARADIRPSSQKPSEHPRISREPLRRSEAPSRISRRQPSLSGCRTGTRTPSPTSMRCTRDAVSLCLLPFRARHYATQRRTLRNCSHTWLS